MKILKGILIGILDIIVFLIMFLFIVSFPLGAVKDVLKEEIFGESFKIQQSQEAENEVLDQTLSEFFYYYSDEFCDDLLYGDKEDDDFAEDFIQYIKDNESLIEAKIGADVPLEMLDFLITDDMKEELNQVYAESLDELINEFSSGELLAVRGYLFMITLEFKVITGAVMAILLLIIALLQWSYYKWVRTLGNILIINGILCYAFGFILKSLVAEDGLSELFDSLVINNNPFYTSGLYALIIGIVLFVIYQVIKHIVIKSTKKIDLVGMDQSFQ